MKLDFTADGTCSRETVQVTLTRSSRLGVTCPMVVEHHETFRRCLSLRCLRHSLARLRKPLNRRKLSRRLRINARSGLKLIRRHFWPKPSTEM
jgi:hypothetical protein